MGAKSIQGNQNLAKTIKMRRNELGLTIEEAAQKADVGTKTWSRYESGESIRRDKCKGICKALNWHSLPTEETEESETMSLEQYQQHEAWSQYLADSFGNVAAVSFAIGSDIMLDHIEEDMRELSKMPKGTHIGQIGVSFIADSLPKQFLMNYDYEFLYIMRTKILHLRRLAKMGEQIIAHSVLDELLMYLIMEESQFLIETDEQFCDDECDEWVFQMFDDMDIISFLYSDMYLTNNHPFHFDSWMKNQFYCETE